MPSQEQTTQGDDAARDQAATPDTSRTDGAEPVRALDVFARNAPLGDAPAAPRLDAPEGRAAFTIDLPPVIHVVPLDGGDVPGGPVPAPRDLPPVPPTADLPPVPQPGTPAEVPNLPPPSAAQTVPGLPPLPTAQPVPNLPPPAPMPGIPNLPPIPEAPPVPTLPPPPPLQPIPDLPPAPVTPDAPPLPPVPPGQVLPADVPPGTPTADPGETPRGPLAPSDAPAPPGADIPKFLPVEKEVVTIAGHQVEIIGGPEKEIEGRHAQGDNPYDVRGDCGLVSSRDILLQFGVRVTEAEVVKYAVEHGICAYDTGKPPENRGGTGTQAIVEVLHHYGVEAHGEYGGSLEQLATNIATGRGVIIGIESSVIWEEGQQPGFRPTGKADHAITVTGVSLEQGTGRILGFYINDSGEGKFGRFVSADLMQRAWVESGGGSVVTNAVGWAPV